MRFFIGLVSLYLALFGHCVATAEAGRDKEQETALSEADSETFLQASSEFNFETQRHSLVRGGNVNVFGGFDDSLDVCTELLDCGNCTAETGCHWCKKDQKCHVIGSWNGCLIGATCDRKDDDDKKKKKDDDSCASNQNCSACANTHTCHWCAHDETCHVIGSVYGCVRGVDCFAEDRCRRKEPEPLPSSMANFTNMDHTTLLVVGGMAAFLFVCVTCCLCFVCGVKGSLDDMWGEVHEGSIAGNFPMSSNTTLGTMPEDEALLRPASTRNQNVTQQAAAAPTTTTTTSATSAEPAAGKKKVVKKKKAPAKKSNENPQQEQPAGVTNNNDNDNGGATNNGSSPQDTSESRLEEGAGNEAFYQALEEVEQQQQQQEESPLLSRSLPPMAGGGASVGGRGGPSKCMKALMCASTCLYILSVLLIGGVTLGALRLFPKTPEYSVCNDSFAWKTLIDNIARLKTQTDFELLLSIENANHVNVAVDNCTGIFKHNGKKVGYYIVPAVIAPAMAITDVLVLGTLEPDKWEAIALTKEYYLDELVLDIDADLYVRAPGLFNISKSVSITDHPIKVSREQDRHLCSCKDWDGNSTANPVSLGFFS